MRRRISIGSLWLALCASACSHGGRQETDGFVVDSDGYVGNDDGGGDGGDLGITEHGDMTYTCGVQSFMLVTGTTPDILIVQDQSASMNNDVNDMPLGTAKQPTSKWIQMANAIKQAVGEVSTIDWGLWLFSDGSDCGVPLDPAVPPGALGGADIPAALDDVTPSGQTPTAAAIQSAAAYLHNLNDSHSHYLLLSTDGEPSCSPDSSTPDVAAESAVTAAAAMGIHTYVIGIGSDPGADAVLTQMAQNGLEPNMAQGEKPYYTVSTTAEFLALLDQIASQIVSCEYPLTVTPTDPSLVVVQGSQGEITRDTSHVNGWDFGSGMQSIVFYGQTCKALQVGSVKDVSATFGCKPVN